MNSSANQQLLQVLTTANFTSIGEVIATMSAIDQSLSGDDGLKWFNLLYLNVTQQVDTQPPPQGWESPVWLTRLDVVFAKLYFSAITNWLQNSSGVPSSWRALFQSRFHGGIDRIQFALAGMNAHINHDLALALLETDGELNLTPALNGPEHADYESVNALLEAVLPQALEFLATGIVGQLAQDTGKIGRLLAIWNVRAARDLAWDVADNLRPLSGVTRVAALAAQDQITGVVGRSLLQVV